MLVFISTIVVCILIPFIMGSVWKSAVSDRESDIQSNSSEEELKP